MDSGGGLARLRATLLGDARVSAEFADMTDDDAFVAHAAQFAGGLGVPFDEAALRRALLPDPLGLSRFAPAETLEPHWPPPGFLPIRVKAQGVGHVVDWAWFGPQPLTEPFFEGAIRGALLRPFSRAFRWHMSLTDFVADAGRQPRDALAPDGFIFHMSRCGSTLVAQMLARCAANIVVSEAAPIDFAVQTGNPHVLGAMIQAFGRRRSGREQRLFVKLDSWHALAVRLFEQAFPDTPWLFLYRNPLEVMVSQQREPGVQMVPQFIAPSFYGLDLMVPGPDYTARVLARICTAAAEALDASRGLAVNYRDLPDAFERRILPHLGYAPDADEREAMHSALGVDAKSPSFPFSPDGETKQAAASALLRALAEQHLAGPVRRLDAIAAAQAGGRAPTML